MKKYQGSGSNRTRGMLQHILSFNWKVAAGQTFQDRMREWLKLVKGYEKHRAQPIPDDVKVATLQAGCSGKLRDHVQLNVGAYHTMDQL
eukprot:8168135-Alexandrium_andersonii.AAC.1